MMSIRQSCDQLIKKIEMIKDSKSGDMTLMLKCIEREFERLCALVGYNPEILEDMERDSKRLYDMNRRT